MDGLTCLNSPHTLEVLRIYQNAGSGEVSYGQSETPVQAGPAGHSAARERGPLERVAAGDPGALDECLEKYRGLVWSLARRSVPNLADAEDAVQEVFIDVWRYADRFNPELGSEANYIGMIARRRLIDRHRKRRRQPDTTTMPETLDVPAREEDNLAERADEGRRAKQSLERLRPQERQVIELFVHGMSHSEIAESTKLPLGTVKTHARRGLARLREMLGETPMENRP